MDNKNQKEKNEDEDYKNDEIQNSYEEASVLHQNQIKFNLDNIKTTENGVTSVPLKYWFKPQKNPQDVINEFPEISRLRELEQDIFSECCDSQKIQNNDPEHNKQKYYDCIECEKLLYELQTYYCQKFMIQLMPGVIPFPDIKIIQDYKKVYQSTFNPLAKKYYENIIETTDQEEINGYKLYNCAIEVFTFEDFQKVLTHIEKHKDSEYNKSYEKFFEKCDNKMCTDWAKMDRNGESFKGAWKEEEGSEEKKNAWHLTREDNIKGLWELPYEKTLIIKTIQIGCRNRQECVRYSNFLCEWVTRMKQKLEEGEEDKIIIEINKDALLEAWKQRLDEYLGKKEYAKAIEEEMTIYL